VWQYDAAADPSAEPEPAVSRGQKQRGNREARSRDVSGVDDRGRVLKEEGFA
jgi:hypothetical protein